MALTLSAPPSPSEPQSMEGKSLEVCSTKPLTGFFRDGRCMTGPQDRGTHVVCAEVSEAFLRFTRSRGNDLSTPAPRYRFAGLKPGDRWCLCALRWKEALEAGYAPPVVPEATEATALRYVSRADLEARSVHPMGAPPVPPAR